MQTEDVTKIKFTFLIVNVCKFVLCIASWESERLILYFIILYFITEDFLYSNGKNFIAKFSTA